MRFGVIITSVHSVSAVFIAAAVLCIMNTFVRADTLYSILDSVQYYW